MPTDPAVTETEIEAVRVAVLAELGQIDRTQPWGVTDAEAASIGRAAILAAAKARRASPPTPSADPTIDAILAAIRETTAKATPGEWRLDYNPDEGLSLWVISADGWSLCKFEPSDKTGSGVEVVDDQDHADAAHIAACSPANMARVLAHVDVLEAKADAWDREGWQDLDVLRAEIEGLRTAAERDCLWQNALVAHRDVILSALTTVERETAQRCAEIAEDLCEFRTRDAITKEFGL